MAQLQRASLVAICLGLVAALCLSVTSVDAQQLTYRYYRTTCPNVEKIIADEVKKAFKKDKTIAPGIVRLLFHDCFVRVRHGYIFLRDTLSFLALERKNKQKPFK